MRSCKQMSSKKYTNRAEPPFNANKCKLEFKFGNDKNLYRSMKKKSDKGYKWRLVSGDDNSQIPPNPQMPMTFSYKQPPPPMPMSFSYPPPPPPMPMSLSYPPPPNQPRMRLALRYGSNGYNPIMYDELLEEEVEDIEDIDGKRKKKSKSKSRRKRKNKKSTRKKYIK